MAHYGYGFGLGIDAKPAGHAQQAAPSAYYYNYAQHPQQQQAHAQGDAAAVGADPAPQPSQTGFGRFPPLASPGRPSTGGSRTREQITRALRDVVPGTLNVESLLDESRAECARLRVLLAERGGGGSGGAVGGGKGGARRLSGGRTNNVEESLLRAKVEELEAQLKRERPLRTEMQAQESGEVLQLHTRCAELTKMNDELRREVHQLRERISFFEGGDDDDDDGGQEEEQRTLADAFADDKETFQFA
ncbi:hypothetical protein RI054_09g47750 [Pseudoscourfieldia marina]